ncbi:cytochrome b5-like heme/steroid binding domain-containing protein [Cladorrhinum sp. PSN332]|nr:cytochrome b5-like heme/steroid binding domain-containing protein [Cladorrhinum sp. PSN332]
MASITTTTTTAAELAKHKTAQDLWVAVHGNVYDLTSFAADHPGGIDILVECAGTDASEPYDYAGHGDDATEAMLKFRVGPLEGHRGAANARNASSSSKSSAAGNSPKAAALTDRFGLGLLGSQLMLVLMGVVTIVGVVVLLMGRLGLLQAESSRSSSSSSSSPSTRSVFGSVDSFVGGMLAASGFGSVGLGWAYLRFRETLKHEKEVFAYPAVIPRRKR